MREYVVLDIETVPLPVDEELHDYYRIHRWEPKSYADDQIKADCSLEPALARVFCVSMLSGDSIHTIKALTDDDEKQLLDEFWQMVEAIGSEYPYFRFVTFNGLNFDFPFLEMRSLIQSVPFMQLPKKRYDTTRHYDVRQVLTNWGVRGLGSLRFWCHVFGIEYTNGIIQAEQIADCYGKKEYQKIFDKCENDVDLINRLYLRVSGNEGN